MSRRSFFRRLLRDLAYIDSNVFIYPVIYDAEAVEKARRAKEVLTRIERGELLAYTSTLTWDEVVWVVSRVLGRSDGVEQGRKLIGFPNLHFIEIDLTILTQAQRLIERYNLKPRDSIHIASALSRKIKKIISDDKDLDRVKEIKRISL